MGSSECRERKEEGGRIRNRGMVDGKKEVEGRKEFRIKVCARLAR